MLSRTKFSMIAIVFGIFLLNILHSQALFPDPKGHSQVRQRPGAFDEFTTQVPIEKATESITRRDVELIKKSEKSSTKTKVLDKLVKEDSIKTTKTKDKTASLKTSTASKSTKNIKSESIVKTGVSTNGGGSQAIKKSENLNLDQTNLQGESIGGNRGMSVGREIKHGTVDIIDQTSNIETALASSSVIVASKGSANGIKTSLENGAENTKLERIKGGVIKSDEFASAKGVKTTSIESEAERVENIKAVHTDDTVIAGSIGGGIKTVERHSSKGVKATSITSETERLIADTTVLKGTEVESSVKTESHSESVVKDSKVDLASSNLDSVEVKESDSLHTKAIKTVFVETEDDDKTQSEHLDVAAPSKLTKEDQDRGNYEDDDEIAVLMGEKIRKAKEEVVKIRDENSHISTRTKVGPGSTRIDLDRDSYAEKPEECCKRVLVSEKTWIEGDMTVMQRKYKTKGSLGQIIYSTETLRKTTKPIRIIGSVGGSTIYRASSSSSSSSSNGYNVYDDDEEDQVVPRPYPARGGERGDLNIALDKMRAPSGDHSEWESAEVNSQNLGGHSLAGTKLTSSTVVREKVSSFSSGGSITSSNLGEHHSYGSDETFEVGDGHSEGLSSSIKTANHKEHQKSTTQIKSRNLRSISSGKAEHDQDGYAKNIIVKKVFKRDVDNHEDGTIKPRPKGSAISSNIEDRAHESFKNGDAHSESSRSIKTSKHKEHHKSSTQIKSRGIRSMANRREAHALDNYGSDSNVGKHFERHIANFETGTKRPRPKRSEITMRSSPLPRKCGKIMLGTKELEEITKIVGGTEVRAGTWPWLVTFQHEGYHFCGGTLISDRHVISATHCFPDFMPPHNLTVNAGKHIKEGVVLPIEQHRKIKRLVKHPGFNRAGKFDNDIALVEVDLPFQFTEYVQPACLPGLNEKIDPKAKCCVAGFGDTRKTANDDVMNELCVPLLPRNLCNSSDFYNGRLTSTMMCAGFEEGKKDSCKGDSGGPLICNVRGVFKLFGITSWGEDCAKPKRPGLYTDISLFQTWIRENL